MKIDVLTLFPEMFESPLSHSILKRAQENGLVDVQFSNFRRFGSGKHQHVDDTPYGGGAGMLLKPEPIFQAIDEIDAASLDTKKRVILVDPAGKRFDQAMAEEFSKEEHLVFICGHYEGYDERIRTLATDEVSLGDYVLTGGELAAMVIMDATIRLLPGVLGNESSALEDSHSNGRLEHPHYTRPADYRGMLVPDVLMSGDHRKIENWRNKQSFLRTLERRPDMLDFSSLTPEETEWMNEAKKKTK